MKQIKLESKIINQSITISRTIDCIRGKNKGPTIIFIGGIHGNEQSSVFALKKVMEELSPHAEKINGNIYALAGNLRALELNHRYVRTDLNRLWNKHVIEQINEHKFEALNEEYQELEELYLTIKEILDKEEGPFYFMDLHTTSSPTSPFLTVNDSLLNRNFTSNYPIPNILGIEEYLDGPLLSYINELGYVAFGFEGGQHQDEKAFMNHEAFIKLSIGITGIGDRKLIEYDKNYFYLKNEGLGDSPFYEIIYRHEIRANDEFRIQENFKNFQQLEVGELIAIHNHQAIESKSNNLIFMPLYQSKGEDGFFIIRLIPKLFLNLSSIIRKLKMDNFLAALPGIHWQNEKKEALLVNKNIAKFFTKQLFHLFGYRNKTLDDKYWIMKSREKNSKYKEYAKQAWFKVI